MAVAAPRARYREFLPRSVRIALGATGRTVSDRRLRHAVQHKVVLVTGASSGIGEATALRMGRAGATVLLLARREKLLQRVRDDIEHSGGQAFVYPCDLRDVDAVEKVAGQILDQHGHVDVIVNNAGHSIRRWISDSYDRFHDFERTIELNYLGPARLIMALLPTMRARHRGHIVNVATAGVNTPAPEWTAYVASKTAFETWLRGVAPEIRADGVTATTIYIQLVRTPMLGPFRVYKFIPGMSADEAAGLVARAVVERPRSIAPWWYRPGTALLWLVDDGAERVMALYPKLFNPASRPGPPLRPVIEAVGATALTADDAVGTATRLFETHVISGLRPDRLARALWNVQRSGVTAASLLTIQAARFPHRTAVIDERGRLSFPQLSQRVDALAAGLYARHHLGPGDRVGIMARNHRGFVEATFASLKLGADVVFLNTEFAGPQLADVLAREGANVAIYDEEFEAILEATGFAGVRLLAWHDGPTASRPTLDELAAEPAEPVRRSGIPGEIVLLTSGSTGTPKGAPRHTDVLRLARQAVPVATPVAIPSVRTALRMASNLTVPRSGDAIVVCPPLFHGFGLGGMLAGLALGSPIVLRRRFDAESTIAAIHRYQAGLLCAVPTMLKRILDLPEPVRARYDISSLRLIACGAAPLPSSLHCGDGRVRRHPDQRLRLDRDRTGLVRHRRRAALRARNRRLPGTDHHHQDP